MVSWPREVFESSPDEVLGENRALEL
jgi:hypothetical protein